MIDIVSASRRSSMMSGIKQRDTAPEIRLRKRLHAMGFRYRLHPSDLPGRPDIVFPRYGVALFVHGCFWHGHICRAGALPTTNTPFWSAKRIANMKRDKRKARELRKLGWRVLTAWECGLKGDLKTTRTVNRIARRIQTE